MMFSVLKQRTHPLDEAKFQKKVRPKFMPRPFGGSWSYSGTSEKESA